MNQNLPKVLVVEDEKSFVEALKVGLDREGFDVKVAEDGLMALELFRTFKPDLILLDVMLPKISGLDVCKEIRTESKVPIIMVTASVSSDQFDRRRSDRMRATTSRNRYGFVT